MCGFVGFTGQFENKDELIREMADAIKHRGPDSYGSYTDDYAAFGFRRLSIIDLAEGSQPIYNEDGSKLIFFNGEIYNYRLLRDELISLGHVFSTASDTETILHGYEEYGARLLTEQRLRGMFAFVIYDLRTREIFGARDYFGIKPFYYAKMPSSFMFGSEIKAFLPHPGFLKEFNSSALQYYLSFQYSALEETMFKNVYKLPPAHYFVYAGGEMTVSRYYSAEFREEEAGLDGLAEKIDDAVQDSVLAHKVSDVEVGSFLSSGVDSSYVAASFHGDKTFTVGFDYLDYSEIDYAKELSAQIGIENYSKAISKEEYWAVLPKAQYHMDEPLADPAAIALYFVSEVASRHVKVALSGEGADEFFGGYNIYREPMDIRFLTRLPRFLRKLLGLLSKPLPRGFRGKSLLERASKSVEERYIGGANIWKPSELSSILLGGFDSSEGANTRITKPFYDLCGGKDDVTKMQFLDIHMWMVGDILLKADKMSMAHSLEVRVPYLDKEVFAVASGLPTHCRVNKRNTKYAFRLAARKHLPEFVSQKKKLGFPVPIRLWLREDEYSERVRAAFESPAAKEFFKTDGLVALLDEHKAGKFDNSRKIWTVYMFLVWYGEFFGS